MERSAIYFWKVLLEIGLVISILSIFLERLWLVWLTLLVAGYLWRAKLPPQFCQLSPPPQTSNIPLF